jgi:hypothetical protein
MPLQNYTIGSNSRSRNSSRNKSTGSSKTPSSKYSSNNNKDPLLQCCISMNFQSVIEKYGSSSAEALTLCVSSYEIVFAQEFASKHLEVTDELLKRALVNAKIPEDVHDDLL